MFVPFTDIHVSILFHQILSQKLLNEFYELGPLVQFKKYIIKVTCESFITIGAHVFEKTT